MSRRRPAFCMPWPWHEKQFCDRIGRTSQFQSGRSGMRMLPASATSVATLPTTWPTTWLLSWAYTRKMPPVTATMLAPTVRLREPILRMEPTPLLTVDDPFLRREAFRYGDALRLPSSSLHAPRPQAYREARPHGGGFAERAIQGPPDVVEPSKVCGPRRLCLLIHKPTARDLPPPPYPPGMRGRVGRGQRRSVRRRLQRFHRPAQICGAAGRVFVPSGLRLIRPVGFGSVNHKPSHFKVGPVPWPTSENFIPREPAIWDYSDRLRGRPEG